MIGVGVGTKHFRRVAASAGALTIATAPTIAGDAVVGQRAYLVHGTYNAPPDFYSVQWYRDGAAILGETADNYLYLDTDAAHTITVGEVAHKASYADSPLNMSV